MTYIKPLPKNPYFIILLITLACPAYSQIPRKDSLVCGFSDSTKFMLTSKYTFSLLALIAPVREHEHRDKEWELAYVSETGHQTIPPSLVNFSGTADHALRAACAEIGGKRNSVAMVRKSFFQKNGEWSQLPPPSNSELDETSLPREAKIKGFSRTILRYALIFPLRDGRIVYEQPLSRSDRGYIYEMRFDGVYQSFSSDNGKTWSDPVITTDALIFQMGKRWIDQCFVARPIEFNGEKITPDFPEPCPPSP